MEIHLFIKSLNCLGLIPSKYEKAWEANFILDNLAKTSSASAFPKDLYKIS